MKNVFYSFYLIFKHGRRDAMKINKQKLIVLCDEENKLPHLNKEEGPSCGGDPGVW